MTKKQMEVYEVLKRAAQEEEERSGRKYTQYNMVSFCIGYYGKVNKTIYKCINRLFDEGFIQA